MASSSLSPMLLFVLLLLLVSPHMDQVESRKLKETNIAGQVTYPALRPGAASGYYGKCNIYQNCKRGPPGQKV